VASSTPLANSCAMEAELDQDTDWGARLKSPILLTPVD
jgi:hypothetical protein